MDLGRALAIRKAIQPPIEEPIRMGGCVGAMWSSIAIASSAHWPIEPVSNVPPDLPWPL